MGLKSRLSWTIRAALQRVGVDVVAYDPGRHPLARRRALFAHHGIDLVIDIGANGGQYGHFLRTTGYRGRILSLEPLSDAFARLQTSALADPAWEVRRTAVGEHTGTATINVAGNSESSSFLPMLPEHWRAYPTSRYTATEEVPIVRLERLIEEVPRDARVFLKVDAQGYERRILEGAGPALGRVCGVQLEMSLVPLYEGESLMPELVSFMSSKGFTLMSIEPGNGRGPTGQLLHIDGLFFRASPEA